MYAKNLEQLLSQLMVSADVSSRTDDDMAERFESLRGYGHLPRGRERRAQLLTMAEIAAAVLGLPADRPGWAGHSATILVGLVPVGGPAASFCRAVNLLTAVECLLADKEARKVLSNLAVSVSESGVNSHGYAEITYKRNGEVIQSRYVSQMATRLQAPGAELTHTADTPFAAVSKVLRFSRKFFDKIVHEVDLATMFAHKPAGSGSEYNAVEAEERRRLALGVRPGSRFLNLGVDNQVTWPAEETLIRFEGYQLVLMPKTPKHVQSIHVDLSTNKLSHEQARTLVNRLLSLMTWCDDQFAVAQDGWSGNPVPVPVPRRNLAFTTASYWLFDRKIPVTEEARRALALYREARNAEQNFLVSYAVLNYFKIIEVKHQGKGPAKNWFRDNYSILEGVNRHQDKVTAFKEACGDQPPHEYIYKACRLAVAHASDKAISDPDESAEIARLHDVAGILRLLARHFIENELGVSALSYSDSQ